MAKKISVAIIHERLTQHKDDVSDVILALMDGGFIVHEVKDWQKTKEGKFLTWLQIEKGERSWCNVCEEKTLTHRLRCEICGARKSAY